MEKKENETFGQHDMSKPLEMDAFESFDHSWSDVGILPLEVVYYSMKYPQRLGLQRYLLQSLPRAQQLLSPIGITYTVDPCFITVSTTRREPAVLRRAKEFLQLLAANMPVELAFRLFEDDELSSCVIKIWRQEGGLCKDLDISVEQFKEREKLFQKSRDALKELTSCKIIQQGINVVVMGNSSGVKIVRDMVRDCFVFNESPAPKIRRAKVRKEIEDLRAVDFMRAALEFRG